MAGMKGLTPDRSTLAKAVRNSKVPSKAKKRERKAFSNIVEGYENDYKLIQFEKNENITVYLPRITELREQYDEEGELKLNEDGSPVMEEEMLFDFYEEHNIHQIREDGARTFAGIYRCVAGISDIGDLDGRCPLCDGYFQTELKWVRTLAEVEAKKKGVDVTDKEAMKAYKRPNYSKLLIDQKSEKVTVPLFVVQTETVTDSQKKKRQKPVMEKDENGDIIYIDVNGEQKPKFAYDVYWYTLGRQRYEKFFVKQVQNFTDDEESLPGGYIYRLSTGSENSKMELAKNVECYIKGEPPVNMQYMYDYFDKEAMEKYTNIDAMTTIKRNQLHSKEDLEALATRVLKPHVKEIAIHAQETPDADGDGVTVDTDLNDLLENVEIED